MDHSGDQSESVEGLRRNGPDLSTGSECLSRDEERGFYQIKSGLRAWCGLRGRFLVELGSLRAIFERKTVMLPCSCGPTDYTPTGAAFRLQAERDKFETKVTYYCGCVCYIRYVLSKEVHSLKVLYVNYVKWYLQRWFALGVEFPWLEPAIRPLSTPHQDYAQNYLGQRSSLSTIRSLRRK